MNRTHCRRCGANRFTCLRLVPVATYPPRRKRVKRVNGPKPPVVPSASLTCPRSRTTRHGREH